VELPWSIWRPTQPRKSAAPGQSTYGPSSVPDARSIKSRDYNSIALAMESFALCAAINLAMSPSQAADRFAGLLWAAGMRQSFTYDEGMQFLRIRGILSQTTTVYGNICSRFPRTLSKYRGTSGSVLSRR